MDQKTNNPVAQASGASRLESRNWWYGYIIVKNLSKLKKNIFMLSITAKDTFYVFNILLIYQLLTIYLLFYRIRMSFLLTFNKIKPIYYHILKR